jgi:hypothetical protein
LKDIKFSINLGLIGAEDSRLDLFIEYLKEKSSKFISVNMVYKFTLRFEGVPMKLRVGIANNFEELIHRNDDFKHFDAIIIAANIYNENSIANFTLQNYDEFRNFFIFNGITALVGIDPFLAFNNDPPFEKKVTEFTLIQKTKELGFLYCFKIQDINKDMSEIFNKVLNYINLKLEFLNPELFKQIRSKLDESNGRLGIRSNLKG